MDAWMHGCMDAFAWATTDTHVHFMHPLSPQANALEAQNYFPE